MNNIEITIDILDKINGYGNLKQLVLEGIRIRDFYLDDKNWKTITIKSTGAQYRFIEGDNGNHADSWLTDIQISVRDIVNKIDYSEQKQDFDKVDTNMFIDLWETIYKFRGYNWHLSENASEGNEQVFSYYKGS